MLNLMYALNVWIVHIVIAYMSIRSLSGKHGIGITFKGFVLQKEKSPFGG